MSDLHQCVKEKEKDVDMKILQVTLPKSYTRKHCFPLNVCWAKVKKHSYIILYYNINIVNINIVNIPHFPRYFIICRK